MSNKQSTYLALLATVTGLLIVLSTSKPLLAQSLPSGTDQGYGTLPRAFVDANGDGRVDYCRFVGDAPNIFIACVLGTPEGFDVANQFTFRSIGGIDQGYGDRPREFRDANGDGKSDYCRFVGNAPNIYEACDLATSVGFDANQFSYLTGRKDSAASNTLAPETNGSVSSQQVDSMKSNFEAFATHYFAQGNRGTATVERFDFDGIDINYRVKLRHYHVTKNALFSATVYDVTSYVEGSFKPSDVIQNKAYPNICVDLPKIAGGDKICQQYKF